jgi:hypothetical protein
MAKKSTGVADEVALRNAEYVRAGAFLPPGSKLPDDEPVDTLEARIYKHPALGDRPVVRLGLASLGAGADATMGVIGFGAAEVKGDLGIGKRQALGFPEAVLVSAPEHASLTLRLVKFLKKMTKMMSNSPGNAKGAIEAEARNADAAPIVLASFYEQAGRMFVEAGNTTYAATFFGKARDTERTYALDVDEERRRDAFVEFALSGALTNKALTEYARDLATRHGDATAYAYFYDLCVRRTLGGSPPSSEMVKQLRRMVKGAGLKQQDEDNRFIEAIWESPSLAKAPPAFWELYKPTLVAFAKARPEVANHLLHLFPEPTQGKRPEFYVLWLSLLEEAGLLVAALDLPVPTDGVIVMEKGCAAWVERLKERFVEGRYYWNYTPLSDAFIAVLRRAAPRIIAEGKPIQLVSGQHYYTYADPDLLDLALELGITLADPSPNAQMNLEAWANPEHHGAERPRDFTLLAADKRFHQMIMNSVGGVIGQENFEATARGKVALKQARDQWLNEQLTTIAAEGMPDAETNFISSLNGKLSASMMAEFPARYEQLKALSILPALTATITNGLPSELHWPALEEAIAKLRGLKKDQTIQITGSFPNVILFNHVRALVVGPDGIILEHDIKTPQKGDEPQTMRFADGQLLINFGYSKRSYWSNKPNDIIEAEGYYWAYEMAYSATLSDGGTSEGGAVLRAGDKTFRQSERVFYDGTTFWKQSWDEGEYKLKEYDPRQDAMGRASMPAWFEQTAKPGWRAMFESSMLFSMPDSLKSSPLGYADGKIGWILRAPIVETVEEPEVTSTEEDEEDYEEDAVVERVNYELTRIDGATWSGHLKNYSSTIVGIRFPGEDALRPMSIDYNEVRVWTPDGQTVTATAPTRSYYGTTVSPYASWSRDITLPLQCWHAMRARDEAGSAALRKLTQAQLEPIFAIALAENAEAKADQGEDPKHCKKTVQAIAKGIPELKDAELRDAIARVILRAAMIQNAISAAIVRIDPTKHKEERSEHTFSALDFQHLCTMVDGGYYYNNYGHGSAYDPVIIAAENFLLTGEQSVQVEPLGLDGWINHLETLGAMARMGFSQGNSEHRAKIVTQMMFWSQRDLFAHPERYRILVCEGTRGAGNPDEDEDDLRVQITHGASRYYGFFQAEEWGSKKGTYTLVEYNEAGEFQEPPKRKLTRSKPLTELNLDAPRLLALGEALGAFVDPEKWDPLIGETIAKRTGLTSSEASLLWVGLPNVNHWNSNFLPKDTRSYLKIKAKDAEVARVVFRHGDRAPLIKLLAASLPADPTAFNAPLGEGEDDKQSPVALLAAAWNQNMGKREVLDEALVLDLSKEISLSIDAKTFISALMDVDKATLLHDYPKHKFDADGSHVYAGDAPNHPVFSESVISSLIEAIPFIIATRPPSHPVRKALPRAVAACVEMLKNEDILFSYYSQYFWGEHAERERKDTLRMIGGKETKKPHMFDNGRQVGVESSNYVNLYLRPAKVARCADDPLLKEHMSGEYGDLYNLDHIRSAELAELVKRAVETPVAEDGDERDPRQSVPELVKTVAATHEVSEDAATLYLVLLGWPAPKEKDIKDGLGWTPKVFKAAVAELVAKDLVLEAKRARAGRTVFLPGRWEEHRSPWLPVESWKAPLYAGNSLWKYPPHLTFQKAWDRLLAGDKPGF